jgi:hypothetical protein
MVIVLRVPVAGATLEDPEDVRRFHVRVEGSADVGEIGRAFEAAGLGRFESLELAHVRVDRVRELARGRVGGAWEESFAGMLGYSASKGWYDEADGSVQAHCELSPA